MAKKDTSKKVGNTTFAIFFLPLNFHQGSGWYITISDNYKRFLRSVHAFPFRFELNSLFVPVVNVD